MSIVEIQQLNLPQQLTQVEEVVEEVAEPIQQVPQTQTQVPILVLHLVLAHPPNPVLSPMVLALNLVPAPTASGHPTILVQYLLVTLDTRLVGMVVWLYQQLQPPALVLLLNLALSEMVLVLNQEHVLMVLGPHSTLVLSLPVTLVIRLVGIVV